MSATSARGEYGTSRFTAPQEVPAHLKRFLATQDMSLYTPMDHAAWRFILRISKAFFKENAHSKYLDGLEETGISTERIPSIAEMDTKLRRFGWRAVPVVGFIPPAIFMEFQSLGFLPIACDMRTRDHIAYTPAPDIVHEAAGHAPIIADRKYAKYLRAYGEVARKAIFSKNDMEIYEAIRSLSDVKEHPDSTESDIETAQQRLNSAVASSSYVSEANLVSRMNWWTVEYGLVGDISAPRIYGAGLLSSVGESYHCLEPDVKKIPFSIDCINVSYDITRPQPQLFVAADFESLTEVLEEMADTMAFRKGGVEGLAKAKMAETVTTIELESGLQVSGVLTEYQTDDFRQPCFIKFFGPVQLSHLGRELPAHDAGYHTHGYSSPIGLVRGTVKSPAELSEQDLRDLGFKDGASGQIEFESGVTVHGRLTNQNHAAGKNLVLTFEDCTVRRGEQTLFEPSWGVFDLACGATVTSVFGGAADLGAYYAVTGGLQPISVTPKTNLTPKNREINEIYRRVRELREKGSDSLKDSLAGLYADTVAKASGDWLLFIEILEIAVRNNLNDAWINEARLQVSRLAEKNDSDRRLIERGLAILSEA